MATKRETVDALLARASAAGDVVAKAMFGEYGLYLDGRMVGSVCDDRLYVKPTPAGRAHAGAVAEGPPYPGAKPCLVIDAERWEDCEWLAELLRVTAAALPAPRSKKRRG